MADYMSTLEAMIAERPLSMLPGHGPHIPDPMGLLSRYVQHRREREAQLWSQLVSHASPERGLVSSLEIATALYTQTLERRLHLASQNCFKILVGLCKEGAVVAYARQPDGEGLAWLPLEAGELWNYSYVQLGATRLERLRWLANAEPTVTEAMGRRGAKTRANKKPQGALVLPAARL